MLMWLPGAAHRSTVAFRGMGDAAEDLRTSLLRKQQLRDEGAFVFIADMLMRASGALHEFDSLSPQQFLIFFEPPSLDNRIVNQFALLSASASTTGSTSSSTTGAVGTSGTAGASASATLDPAIRAKLEEFRTRLQAFHSAAGREAAVSGSTGSMGSAAVSAEAETHIAAIEKILNEASGGTVTLDRAKLEEIRMRLQQRSNRSTTTSDGSQQPISPAMTD